MSAIGVLTIAPSLNSNDKQAVNTSRSLANFAREEGQSALARRNSPGRAVFSIPNEAGRPMTKDLKASDTVSWETSQGETHGKIVKRQTEPTQIKTHKVAASKDNPEYIVKSDKTGALAAHKPEALKKS
jgi:hypothetical protein